MDDVGFGYEAEGTQVPQADPCQYYVAQLPTGRFHYWGVPEPEHIQTQQLCAETCKQRHTDMEKYSIHAKNLNTHSGKQ